MQRVSPGDIAFQSETLQHADQIISFAVIDTVCHTEPVSGYFVMGDKDVSHGSEGKESYELHPTYRAVIDTIRHAGFSEIFEVVGRSDKPHPLYATGNRRCFLAIK